MFQQNQSANQQPPMSVSIDELNNLFNDDSAIPKTSWMKFVNIGDSIQGIMVEEQQYGVPSRKYPDQLQTVITLKTAEDDIILVGFNQKSQVLACRLLKQAEVGDMVGIKFVSTFPTDKGNPGKNFDIRIKHNNGAMDTAHTATAPAQAMTPEQKLNRIIAIAIAKLGATTPEDAKLKAMEVTGIPCLPAKYDQMLAVLEGMAKI